MPRLEPRGKASVSKLLVVDASVLRASGAEDAVHPVPANCRDLLKLILEVCHRTAVTDPIVEEWNRHQSRFARQWRGSMNARGKMQRVDATDCSDIRAMMHQPQALTATEVDAGEKDLHLVAAARSSDRIIISGDNAAQSVFRKLTSATRAIADVLWIDPVREIDPLRAWLGADGPTQPHWRLGSAPATVRRPRGRRPKQGTHP